MAIQLLALAMRQFQLRRRRAESTEGVRLTSVLDYLPVLSSSAAGPAAVVPRA